MTTTREAALEAALIAISDLQGKSGHEFARLHPALNAELDQMPQNRWYEVLADHADAAISAPATEPQGYVAGLEAALRGLLPFAVSHCEQWGADPESTPEVVAARIAIAARPAPHPAADHDPECRIVERGQSCNCHVSQPAADTRVVTVQTLDNWQVVAENHGLYMAEEIRAIIGTATPAPSDKIAEAALVLLGRWNTIDQDDPDMDVVLKIMGIMNSGDDDDRFDAALRALAGKGE